MGSSKQTTTQTNTIPGIGQEEARARAMMMQLAQGGMDQLGDMSALARGDMSITGQDEAFIRQISQLTGEMNRAQAQQNYEAMSSQLEGELLGRGLEGSSIEAVQQAVMGRQLQQSLDQASMQQQITNAQQLQQQATNRAGIQLNANQLLLQRILGGAGGVSQMGLQERLAQGTSTQTTETPFNWGAAVGGALGTAAGAALGGPAGAALGSQLGGGGGAGLGAPTLANPQALGTGVQSLPTPPSTYGGQQSIPQY